MHSKASVKFINPFQIGYVARLLNLIVYVENYKLETLHYCFNPQSIREKTNKIKLRSGLYTYKVKVSQY